MSTLITRKRGKEVEGRYRKGKEGKGRSKKDGGRRKDKGRDR